jgi:hypothetical protein
VFAFDFTGGAPRYRRASQNIAKQYGPAAI